MTDIVSSSQLATDPATRCAVALESIATSLAAIIRHVANHPAGARDAAGTKHGRPMPSKGSK